MKGFQIFFSDRELQVWNDSSIIIDTDFCLQHSNGCFPDDQWTDFVYPVLSMWTEEVVKNKGRRQAQYTLPFMDGPFWVQVKQHGRYLQIKGINGRKKPYVEFSCDCYYEELLEELLRSFNKLEKLIYLNDTFFDSNSVNSVQRTITYYKDLINRELSQGKKA